MTVAIKINPDLPKVDFIQPLWYFPLRLNIFLNEILNIRAEHKNIKIFS